MVAQTHPCLTAFHRRISLALHRDLTVAERPLVNRPCGLFFDLTGGQLPAALAQKVGEGTAPAASTGQSGDAPVDGGTSEESGSLPRRTILPVAGVTLLLAAGVGFGLRMRRWQHHT